MNRSKWHNYNPEVPCAALPLVWKLDSFKMKFPVVAVLYTANVCTREINCISFGRNENLFSVMFSHF